MFQKIINGYIFYFLGQLFGGQLFELFARETNLKKQSSVWWRISMNISSFCYSEWEVFNYFSHDNALCFFLLLKAKIFIVTFSVDTKSINVFCNSIFLIKCHKWTKLVAWSGFQLARNDFSRQKKNVLNQGICAISIYKNHC